MKVENLRTNQLSDEAFDWYLAYLTALDAKDMDAYAGFLAEDVELIMNNAEPTNGRDAVREGLAGYWQTFGELEHELLNIYGGDDRFVLEALNHYVTQDDRRVTLRAVAFTDRNEEGLVTSVRLFSDTGPLFS